MAFACGEDADGGSSAGDAGLDAGAGGAAGGSGSGGTGTADGGPDADAGSGANLGAACTNDADCTGGLSCVKKGVKRFTEVPQGEYYPPHGICSTACETDADCAALAKGSGCRSGYNSVAVTKFCLEPCKRATQTSWGTLPPEKCHGRTDMSCSVQGLCEPSCGSAADCETGDDCYFMGGLCKTGSAPVNVDWGASAPCATNSSVSFPDTDGGSYYYCTGVCTFGSTTACGNTLASGKATSGCYLLPLDAQTGPGDRAHCARLCDCDADCLGPTVCLAMHPQAAQAHGRYGFCWAPTASDLGKPCPADAGSE